MVRRTIETLSFCLVFLISTITPLLLSAQTPPDATNGGHDFFKVRAAASSITIDGNPEEKAWNRAEIITLDYETYPEVNGDPPVETTCYVTYDDEYLYVAFQAQDPNPENIRAHLMDRDEMDKMRRDDHVGFMIDTFNKGEWAFQFRVNPLGVQADAMFTDQTGDQNFSWDAIWKSDARITPDGYEAEIRIPFSSLNLPSSPQQTWRIRAYRSYPRSDRHRIISHKINLDQRSQLAQLDRISGFRNMSSGLNLEVNPVITSKRTDSRGSGGSLNPGSVSFNPGGNIRWGIRPNMNLNATLNPDFSQIEADALQLRENARFVLSFPEKRPFFLEGSEIFDTPFDAVFTRSIIDPIAGFKFTGKSGNHAFGSFITRDQQNRMVFPANQGSSQEILDQDVYSEIFRYRNRITEKGAVGVLAEGRQSASSDYRNYVLGVDGYYRFLNSNTLNVQYLHSSTNYPDRVRQNFNQPENAFGGGALSVEWQHGSRNWIALGGYESVSPGFRNDSGFFPRADYRKYAAGFQYIFRDPSSNWVNDIRPGMRYDLTTDYGGRLTDRRIQAGFRYSGPVQSEVFSAISFSKSRFGGRLFDNMKTLQAFGSIQPSSFLSQLRIYVATGDEIDFTNVRKAKELIIHPGMTLNLGRHLNLELDPNYQRLSTGGQTIFNTYLLGTRMVYHFNKRTFLRSIVQYRYTERNLSRFDNPSGIPGSSESLFYQLLFSYKINPQSKVFLGYSSGYDAVNARPLDIHSRTGFLKIGYAWVF